MPVNAGGFRQSIGDKYPDLVTLDHFNCGPRALSVVAPHVDLEPWCHFSHHWLCNQMKLFHPFVEAVGQGPAVQRDNGLIVKPVG